MYHCARHELETEGLIFGNGTQLYVLPSMNTTEAPQVFELKNKEENVTACLAKDFFPKDIQIYADNIKQESISRSLSKEGFYSAVSVQNVEADNFTCEVKQDQNKITTSKDIKKLDVKEQEADNKCQRTDGSGVHGAEPFNMLSLTVLGMRTLFAKTLAFNLLLSAKIFIM